MARVSFVYVYAVVKAARAPRFARTVRALPQMKPPRAVAAGRQLWLVVSDADAEAYAAVAIERGLRDMEWVATCATAHERVVEAAARHGATVPMKLFTLFANEERAIAHLTRARMQIDRTLARVAGAEEWGVRVVFDPARAAKAAAAKADAEARGLGGGAGFLLKKKRVRDAESGALAGAQVAAETLFEEVASVARDAKKKPLAEGAPHARVVLDAVALVPRRSVRRLESTLKKAASRLAAVGLEIVVTGPWPPYHFVAG
jgi:Gas vesicle synthesis protein GvpL/GvpF